MDTPVFVIDMHRAQNRTIPRGRPDLRESGIEVLLIDLTQYVLSEESTDLMQFLWDRRIVVREPCMIRSAEKRVKNMLSQQVYYL